MEPGKISFKANGIYYVCIQDFFVLFCVCVCVCVYDAQKVLLGAAWLYQHVVSSQTICRFLLGRHKAALDTYAEALTLNPHDWVCGQGMDIASYPARLGEEERVC